MNLFSLACSVPWLITEDAFRTVLEIAAREDLDPELARQIREEREARPSAVAARTGKPLDGADRVSVRDGVALMPVIGPIVRRGGFFSDVSGASSIARLATDFHAALADPQIRAILLVVDSPGGEANGVNEFADMVFAARGQKPIWAYIEGMGASAAYWIASAADVIICDAIAVVGSIGAVRTMPTPSGGSARTVEIVSSQSPNKRPDVTTERGRAQIQGQVDALADVFVAAVARNRDVSVETVLADFGQGGLFIGQGAVDAGLVDRIGSFEATLAELVQRTQPQSLQARPYRTSAQEESMDWKKVFSGLFAAAAEVEAEQAPAASEEQPPAVSAAATDVASAELEQLRAELAARDAAAERELTERALAAVDSRVKAAAAFAEAQIAGEHALPADREALVTVFEACVVAGCEAQLSALFADRPAAPTQELLPANADVKAADRTADTAAAQRAQADRLMAQTPLGQAALKRRQA